MLKSNCVYNNVDVVYSIGDIHGDYQTFKKILLDIGLDPLISNGKNIFQVYTKNIYGRDFELCRINKNNITNDNFCIVQCGDILYSVYKKVKTDDNEELKLLLFIYSLINSFNIISTPKKLFRCRYIQLLGNHDILILASNCYNCLEDNFKRLNYFHNIHQLKQALWKIKGVLFDNGLIFCKINNVLYTHCFFTPESNQYLYDEALKLDYYKNQINILSSIKDNNILNLMKSPTDIIIESFNIIIKFMISEYHELRLNVDKVHELFLNNIRYFNKELMNNQIDEWIIRKDLNVYFGCDKIIMGHMYSPYYKEYFNGLIKVIDIGISQKMVLKYNLKRNFEIFYCCLCKNNFCLIQK